MATWYVRPDTTHSATRNGNSYATAWGAWAEIVWGVSGVTAGDTLYICGTHSYSTNITVGAHLGVANNRCTISGAYAPSPGIVTFTGNFYLQNDRSYTNFVSLGVPSILQQSNASFCDFRANTFTVLGNAQGINISGSTGSAYSDIIIDSNTFTSSGTSTNTSAIKWFISTANASTLTRLTVSNNQFTGFNASRSVLQLRSQTDSDPATRMQDILVFGNTYTNCQGTCVELTSPGNPQAYGTSSGARVYNNTFTNITESIVTPGIGGCIGVWGFTDSTTPGFGKNIISGNSANGSQGATGFVDIFYGTYTVQDNAGTNFSSTTIDSNGILFDLGCNNCLARRNYLTNLMGHAGSINSGVAIMILNDCTNVVAYGNVFDNVNVGVFYGASGSNSSGNIHNNTFANVRSEAVHMASSATIMGSQFLKNNLYSGVGYAVNQNLATPWNNEDYNYFYGFGTGTNNHTLGAHSVTGAVTDIANIMLMNPSTYLLGAGSPGIYAGTFAGYSSDYSNRPHAIPCSIGAQENKNISTRAPRV